MRVEKWMVHRVHTCRAEDSLADAARKLREMDCGCLPVVDQIGAVVGILTDRDICMVAGDTDEGLDKIRVSSLKRRAVITCSSEDDEQRVIELILANRVRRLPVVNPEGGLVGIVSLGDLAGLVTDGDVGITAQQVVEVFARFSRARYRTRYSDHWNDRHDERSQGHQGPPVGTS